MRFLLGAALGAVASGSAFEGVDWHAKDLASHDGLALQHAASLFSAEAVAKLDMHKVMSEHEENSKNIKSGPSGPCKKCAVGGAEYIMKAVAVHVDAWCKKNEDEGEHLYDKKQYWCSFWEKHRNIGLGMLVVQVHPLELAGAWCSGKGICKKTELEAITANDNDISVTATFPPTDMSYFGLGLEEYMAEAEAEETWDPEEHWEHFHHPTLWQRILRMFGFGPKPEEMEISEEVEEEFPFEKGHKGHGKKGKKGKGKGKGFAGHVCKKCYVHVFKRVMQMSIAGVKKMCQVTKCPFQKAWCAWAANHKEIALGMILQFVEPWKYAIGRCWKPKGHGKGHKGHGKGHKGHGKGHWEKPTEMIAEMVESIEGNTAWLEKASESDHPI